jgi:peptidoglycan/LPS O-acetylase OafA/YrhL
MPVLDAVRGLAIVLVLADAFHLDVEAPSRTGRALLAVMALGWFGVQLFFVLSGFLITGILLDGRHGERSLRSFYARRVLRIFPLYYVTLTVTLIIIPLATGWHFPGSEHQLWLWIYLSNWTIPFGLRVFAYAHFWSLAVEEQFYLCWPLIVRWTSRRGLALVCLLMIAAAPLGRLLVRALGAPPEAAYMFTFCRMDALAMGALAALALRVPAVANAVAARQRAIGTGTVVLVVLGALTTRLYPRLMLPTQVFGYSILALAFLVLLVSAVLAQARSPRLASVLGPGPLRAVGKYSYAMYVLHPLVHHWIGLPLMQRLGIAQPDTLAILGYFLGMSAVTFGLAMVSYHLLEKHFLRLKSHFPVARPEGRVVEAFGPAVAVTPTGDGE